MPNLSYASQAEKDADKQALKQAREALDVTPGVLCLDECGLWQLKGHRGRITTWGDGEGYLLSIYEMRSRLAWTWARKRLEAVGCAATQVAELEGSFRFALPLPAGAAEEIRALAGLHQRRIVSAETTAARIFHLQRVRKRTVGSRTGDEGLGGIWEPPTAIGAPRGLKPPSSGRPQQRDLP